MGTLPVVVPFPGHTLTPPLPEANLLTLDANRKLVLESSSEGEVETPKKGKGSRKRKPEEGLTGRKEKKRKEREQEVAEQLSPIGK